MRRSGLGNFIELSLTVRLVLIVVGIAVFVGGIALVELWFVPGVVLIALGFIVAFVGMGSSASMGLQRRGASDTRKSETRMKGGYTSENPWDTMGKGER